MVQVCFAHLPRSGAFSLTRIGDHHLERPAVSDYLAGS